MDAITTWAKEIINIALKGQQTYSPMATPWVKKIINNALKGHKH